MGKSIRSKIKRKFRAIKAEKLAPVERQRTVDTVATMPDAIRPKGIEYKPRQQPLDMRVSCAAFRLAFPDVTAAAEEKKKMRDEVYQKTSYFSTESPKQQKPRIVKEVVNDDEDADVQMKDTTNAVKSSIKKKKSKRKEETRTKRKKIPKRVSPTFAAATAGMKKKFNRYQK